MSSRERNKVVHFGMAGDLLMECGMDRNPPIERIEEAFREIAVLSIALAAPLDVALAHTASRPSSLD